MESTLILDAFFAKDAFWMVNKKIAKLVGVEAALLLSDLYSKSKYFNHSEWFFNTVENIQEDTTLTRYQQDKCIKVLVEIGFIETNRNTVGGKRQFKINSDNLLSCLISRNEKTLNLEVKKLDIQKSNNLQSHIIKIKNKNKEDKNNNSLFTSTEENLSKPKKAKIEKVLTHKEMVCKEAHGLLVKFFCETFRPSYQFERKDGMAVKRLIQKLYGLIERNGEPTKESINSAFMKICYFLSVQTNTFYSTMDLCKIDSNFNTIITMMSETKKPQPIKQNQTGGRII